MSQSALAEILEDFGKQWEELCDYTKIYDDSLHSTLRLIKGDRDVLISFDRHYYQVFTDGSSRGLHETHEEWLSNPGSVERKPYTMGEFIWATVTDKAAAKRAFKDSGRSISFTNMKRARWYLELSHQIIDAFVRYWLSGGEPISRQ